MTDSLFKIIFEYSKKIGYGIQWEKWKMIEENTLKIEQWVLSNNILGEVDSCVAPADASSCVGCLYALFRNRDV